VEDELEQVEVAAVRHGTEEVAADRGQATVHAGHLLDDLGEVEDDTAGVRVALEQPLDQAPVTAADVDDAAERRDGSAARIASSNARVLEVIASANASAASGCSRLWSIHDMPWRSSNALRPVRIASSSAPHAS
jgi:hypothetical protein